MDSADVVLEGNSWAGADPGTAAVLHGMMTMLSEVLDGLDRRLAGLEAAVARSQDQARADLPAMVEEATGAALRRVVDELAPRLDRLEALAQQPDGDDERLAGLEQAVAAARNSTDAAAALTDRIGERLSERIDGFEEELAAARGEALTAADMGRALAALPAPDVAVLEDRIAALAVAVAEVGDSIVPPDLSRVEQRLTALDASIADLGPSVDAAVSRLGAVEAVLEGAGDAAATANAELSARLTDVDERLMRIRPVDDSLYAAIIAVGERLAHTDDVIGEAMVDLRALLEDRLSSLGLESLQAAVAELAAAGAATNADLLAALADVQRAMVDVPADTAGPVLAAVAELRERMAKPRPVDEAIKAGIKAVGERLERREDPGVDPAVLGLVERVAQLDDGVNDGLRRLTERLANVLDSVELLRAETGTGFEEAPARVIGGLRPALEDTASRLEEVRGAVDLAAARMGQANGEAADDMRAALGRLHEVMASVAALSTDVAHMGDDVRRLTEDDGRTQALLDAVASSAQESHDRMRALHSSLTRRFDAALAQAPPPAPSADAVEITRQQAAVAHALERFVAAVDAQAEGLARVQETLASMHGAFGGSLEKLRASTGEGLAQLGRRQAGGLKTLEHLVALMEREQESVESLHALCQSFTGSMEQGGAMGGRVADLVLETRAALRGDMERVEAAVHLEAVKQQQQGQAHLSKAVATIDDVVERESMMVAQRVAAVAAAVETIRGVLHTHVEDTARGLSAP